MACKSLHSVLRRFYIVSPNFFGKGVAVNLNEHHVYFPITVIKSMTVA